MESLGPEERVYLYALNVINALEQIERQGFKHEIIDIVRSYVKDSLYYLSKGDYITALSDIAYAEGLLDALRLLGLVKFEWARPHKLVERARRKVMVAGTFEILHPGHLAYLRYAWSLGRVVAVIARDSTVKAIKKRDVVIPETQRLEVLQSVFYVSKVRLGHTDDMFRVVEEERPDIIVLGPNQPFDEDRIRAELRRRGINAEVIRCREYLDCPLCSTTRIMAEIASRFKPP